MLISSLVFFGARIDASNSFISRLPDYHKPHEELGAERESRGPVDRLRNAIHTCNRVAGHGVRP